MASVVETSNRALQKLGASRITSLSDDSKNARACSACYTRIRDAMLRRHQWNFAIARAELAASTTAPAFGPANAYPLPADFLRLLPNNRECDWQIEGDTIVTNDNAPLKIRYVRRVEDANQFDILFDEALSCNMALEMCEELTQSDTKATRIKDDLKTAMAEAKRINAFESNSAEPPEDGWLLARY